MTRNNVVNLRAFRQKARHHKKSFRSFLTRLQKHTPRGIDEMVKGIEKEIWKVVGCTGCANCCKQMSPTYTAKDIRRIARHLQMTPASFKLKWLNKDRSGDWVNRSTPCQFLDLSTNMCGIYAVRPTDCAGFPHLSKRRFKEYVHVHKQNIELCPATFRMVEKLLSEL
jgi:Fe-S-cluster containining protein